VINSLGRTTLLVRDYDEAVAFYRDRLGFEILHDDTTDGQRYLHIGVPGQPGAPPVGLWLLQPAMGDAGLVGRQAGGQPFLVLYTKDCVDTVKRLEGEGVAIHRQPVTVDGATFAHIADLYGNRIVLVEVPQPPAPPPPQPAPSPPGPSVPTTASYTRPFESERSAPAAFLPPPAIDIPASPFVRLRARSVLTQAFFASVVLLLFAQLIPGVSMSKPTDPALFAVFYLGIGLVLLGRGQSARLDFSRLFGPKPTSRTIKLIVVAVPLGLLSLAGFWLLFLPLSYAAPDFVRSWAIENAANQPVDNVSMWIGRTIIAVIVAPLVEEVLFRGFLLHRWALRWGTGTGVVLSSILFALGHVELLGHFLFGVVMCALYLRTRSLWVPIAAHSLNNLVVSVATLPDAFHPNPQDKMTIAYFQSHWWVGASMLVGGLLLLEIYRRWLWKGIDVRGVLNGPTPYEHNSVASRETLDAGYTGSR